MSHACVGMREAERKTASHAHASVEHGTQGLLLPEVCDCL